MMNRRHFIKSLLGTSLVTVGSCVFRVPLISSASATPTGLPTLVVIFQRGGCDGLNVVVPYADNNYYQLRPTIGIPAPTQGNAFSALDLDGFFGLHPSMASLMPLYSTNNMAVLPTVQYPSPSRSHFDSQFFIESGVSPENLSKAQIKNQQGWLNRHLQTTQLGSLPFQAVSFGSNLTQALRGSVAVQSFSSINSFNLGVTGSAEQNLINSVQPVYQQQATPQTAYRKLVHQYGQTLFNNLSAASAIDTSSYVTENNAVYPSGSYGRSLKEAAQLIKDPNIGLQVVTINQGGYDTHSKQGGGEPNGRQAKRLKEFSDGIAALSTDLGDKMNDVIILTMTEFGRTARENGSLGTDHGNAASWLVIGNHVQGGVYLNGGWPGLSQDKLFKGRYLAATVDYRNIYGDILLNHLGHTPSELSSLLPGHNYQSLGLIT